MPAVSMSLILAMWTATGQATTLERELHGVDQLRAGQETPFEEVEHRCKELLLRYTSPEEQARIYFELVQVEGQSGFQRPEKIETYIRKALDLPLDPDKRIRVYVYWGDSIQIAHRGARGSELAAARREAVVPYLRGLKEVLDCGLRGGGPERPTNVLVTHHGPEGSAPPGDLSRRLAEQADALRERNLSRRLAEERTVIKAQVALLYSRMPFASDELRELAWDVLGDQEAVDDLMSAVESRIRERLGSMQEGLASGVLADLTPRDADAPLPEGEPVQRASSGEGLRSAAPTGAVVAEARSDGARHGKSLHVWLAGAVGALLVVVFVFVVRRLRKLPG